ncbi:MAG TPA: molybdate ABC transporter substrate-binding protein [Gaiellaceae bacterium]|nr:molybdate ABC transporter substrate-binding protein [Gaiellaceae bacterium]
MIPHLFLTIFAAASLTNVFPQIAPNELYSFGGSNTLSAQIQQGAPADIFASANTKLPQALYSTGFVEKPVVFTRNALILIVPKSNPAGIHSVYDLAKPGVKLDMAAAGVPVGDYTRTVLHNLGLDSVVGKAVSQETDVREVLAKVALGEADAGFVYTTDARTVKGKVATIGIRWSAQPIVAYGIAVVRTSTHLQAARQFVQYLLTKAAQKKLLAAGFLPRK